MYGRKNEDGRLLQTNWIKWGDSFPAQSIFKVVVIVVNSI